MSKTKEQMIQEFLDNGGEIQKLPTVETKTSNVVGSLTKKQTTLLTLEEAESLYGEKSIREVKNKKPNISGINMELIPDHLKRLILSRQDNDNTKEQT
jgi:hypothetical protein